MTAIAIALFIAASGLFAAGVIFAAVQTCGGRIRALRDERARCPEMRTFSYRIVTQQAAPRPAARVIAFPVKVGVSRPAAQPFRAAA